jgi:hypothetical protein
MFIDRSAGMFAFRLFAATGNVVARLNTADGASVQTTIVLGNEHQSRKGHIVNGVMCVAVVSQRLAGQRNRVHGLFHLNLVLVSTPAWP